MWEDHRSYQPDALASSHSDPDMLVGGSWGDTELTDVDGYSGYLNRHFAIGPGAELDLVYADTLTGDLLVLSPLKALADLLQDFHVTPRRARGRLTGHHLMTSRFSQETWELLESAGQIL